MIKVTSLGVLTESSEVKEILQRKDLWEFVEEADSHNGMGDPLYIYKHKILDIYCGGYCCPHPYSPEWERWGYTVYWGKSPIDIKSKF